MTNSAGSASKDAATRPVFVELIITALNTVVVIGMIRTFEVMLGNCPVD